MWQDETHRLWIQNLMLPLWSYASLRRALNLSEAQFPIDLTAIVKDPFLDHGRV